MVVVTLKFANGVVVVRVRQNLQIIKIICQFQQISSRTVEMRAKSKIRTMRRRKFYQMYTQITTNSFVKLVQSGGIQDLLFSNGGEETGCAEGLGVHRIGRYYGVTQNYLAP